MQLHGHVVVETEVPLVPVVGDVQERGNACLDVGCPNSERAVTIVDLRLELGDVVGAVDVNLHRHLFLNLTHPAGRELDHSP
jgi:hypothetical protein